MSIEIKIMPVPIWVLTVNDVIRRISLDGVIGNWWQLIIFSFCLIDIFHNCHNMTIPWFLRHIKIERWRWNRMNIVLLFRKPIEPEKGSAMLMIRRGQDRKSKHTIFSSLMLCKLWLFVVCRCKQKRLPKNPSCSHSTKNFNCWSLKDEDIICKRIL